MQIEKEKLVAGLDWNFSDDVADYPASTHTLKYLLKKSTANPITLTSTADGSSHKFEIDDDYTSTYPAGTYAFTAFVFEIATPDNIVLIDTGVVEIFPDLATVSDSRSFAMKMVDAYKDAIYKLAQKTMSDVTIEGHSYTYKDEDKMLARLNYWELKAGVYKKKRHLETFSNI